MPQASVPRSMSRSELLKQSAASDLVMVGAASADLDSGQPQAFYGGDGVFSQS